MPDGKNDVIDQNPFDDERTLITELPKARDEDEVNPLRLDARALAMQFRDAEYVAAIAKKARGPHNRARIPKVMEALSDALEKLSFSNANNIEQNLNEFEGVFKSEMRNFVKVKGALPKYLQELISNPISSLLEKLRDSMLPHTVVATHQEHVAEEVKETIVERDYHAELDKCQWEILKFDFEQKPDIEKFESTYADLEFLIAELEKRGNLDKFKDRLAHEKHNFGRYKNMSSSLLILKKRYS